MRHALQKWWWPAARGRCVMTRGVIPGVISGAIPGATLGMIPGSCPVMALARLAVIMLPRRGETCGLARAQRATTAVEFAICALAMVLIVVGFIEFGRLTWSFEVLQEVAAEAARCMGLGASSCSSGGVYSSANTTGYIVTLANSRGVVINAGMVALNATATCGGATGFSQVSITYGFVTAAPVLLTSLADGFTVPASACFPNHT
jgi:Flp pilus assembly protein TadG